MNASNLQTSGPGMLFLDNLKISTTAHWWWPTFIHWKGSVQMLPCLEVALEHLDSDNIFWVWDWQFFKICYVIGDIPHNPIYPTSITTDISTKTTDIIWPKECQRLRNPWRCPRGKRRRNQWRGQASHLNLEYKQLHKIFIFTCSTWSLGRGPKVKNGRINK